MKTIYNFNLFLNKVLPLSLILSHKGRENGEFSWIPACAGMIIIDYRHIFRE